MSLRLRLTLTYSALLALTLTIFGVILYTTMDQNLRADMDRRLEVRASQVQLAIGFYSKSLTAADLTSNKLDLSPLTELKAPGLYVQVLDPNGQVLAISNNLQGIELPVYQPSIDLALKKQPEFYNVGVVDTPIRMLSVPITADGNVIGILDVGQSLQPLADTMMALQTRLLLLGAGALLLAALLGWLVAHHGLRPLSAISAQAAAIAAQHDFRQRLGKFQRKDEVGQLVRTIDDLLATVDATLRTHHAFVADTSHELRNPLLAIRTNLALLDRAKIPKGYAECIHESREQVERMSRLVSDLLLLAQIEVGLVIEWQPVRLRPLVERALHQMVQSSADRNLRLARADDVDLLGDERRVTQILTNLLDNAVQHTQPNGTIAVRLERRRDWATISVEDSGEGIAPEDLPHIFERFYRAKTNAHREGTGLGLAIVQHLAEAHGGRVTVESALGHGSRFVVWLPINPIIPHPTLISRSSDPQTAGIASN